MCIVVYIMNTVHSYRVWPVIWDHTALSVTWHEGSECAPC